MTPERSDSARQWMGLIAVLIVCSGCGETPPATDPPVARVAPLASSADQPPVLSAADLRRRLGTDDRATFRRVGTDIVEVYLAGTGVQSIEALRGLPLKVLDLGFCSDIDDISVVAGMPLKTLILEGTSVADLSPLTGMPLEVLHLQDTPVTDLAVLKGMPLRQLNLKGVAVKDVTQFAEMPLSILWLLETDVTDISPLKGMNLQSLDVQDTSVADIGALSHMTTLRRLNIGGTRVSDIRPVTGLRLERIFLSPDQIVEGMDELRDIPSLATIGTSHEHQFPAEDFWKRYDSGAWGGGAGTSNDSAPSNEESEAAAENEKSSESDPVPDETLTEDTGDAESAEQSVDGDE